jgi:hypothetical protein
MAAIIAIYGVRAADFSIPEMWKTLIAPHK